MLLKYFSNATPRQQRVMLVILILIGCMVPARLWLSYSPEVRLKKLGREVRLKKPGREVNIKNHTHEGDGNRTRRNISKVLLNKKEKSKVVILMWTRYYRIAGDPLLGLILRGRKWKSCCDGEVEVTLDRDKLDKATAIVFYSFMADLNKTDLPKTRRPDQLWVLFGKESPYLTPELSIFNSLFNWTMTYRQDSEIWAPYGETIKLNKDIPEEKIKINGISLDKWISGKTELITGVNSHCPTPSKREDYIKLLQNITKIDIYGKCGEKICSRYNYTCNHTGWWTQLASKYKFYFAAENAICVDYITEKFWRALDIGMVPVVYGGGNYAQEAPPNSYIDVGDFLSHKELVQYLVYLNSSDDKYRKYFSWRSKYNIRRGESWQGWCDLCTAVLKFKRELEANDNPNTLANLFHVYTDLGRWWNHKPFPENDKRACSKPDFE